jgi:hypothetical protein
MKEIDNLKNLLMQNGIENVPNANFISEALDKLIELKNDNKELRATTINTATDFSEDTLISQGVHFPSWEKGHNSAVDVIDGRMSSI